MTSAEPQAHGWWAHLRPSRCLFVVLLSITQNHNWCGYFPLPFSLSGTKGSDMRNMFPSCRSEVEPDVTGLADAAVSRRQSCSTNRPMSACSVPGMGGVGWGWGDAVSLLGKVCTSIRKRKKTRQLKISRNKDVQYETWQSSGKPQNSCYLLRSLRWSDNPVLETSD